MTIRRTEFLDIMVRHGGSYVRVTMEEATGQVSVYSDYGDWSYRWTAIGDTTLPEFVAGLDSQYAGGKFLGAALRVFSVESTVELIRRHILELRRDATYTKDFAATEWEQVGYLESGDYDFRMWCENTKIADAYEFSSEEVDAAWLTFWRKLWEPYVIPALREVSESPPPSHCQWRLVSDGPPEYEVHVRGKRVATAIAYGPSWHGEALYVEGRWEIAGVPAPPGGITHWMPLPAPPK